MESGSVQMLPLGRTAALKLAAPLWDECLLFNRSALKLAHLLGLLLQHLAPRRRDLALAAFAGLLEVLVATKIRKDPGLLTLLLEASERPLKGLSLLDADSSHAVNHP